MLRIERNPAACMLVKHSGLDFFMLDCEQSSYTFESIHDMCLTAQLIGLGAMLRVPVMNKEWISRALDCGAFGIMVPMVETVEQAQELVWWAKYPPVGNRGYAGGGVKTLYAPPKSPVEEMSRNNEKVITIAQIETKLGVEKCREDCSGRRH